MTIVITLYRVLWPCDSGLVTVRISIFHFRCCFLFFFSFFLVVLASAEGSSCATISSPDTRLLSCVPLLLQGHHADIISVDSTLFSFLPCASFYLSRTHTHTRNDLNLLPHTVVRPRGEKTFKLLVVYDVCSDARKVENNGRHHCSPPSLSI